MSDNGSKQMLRVAVPNKGALAEKSAEMLAERATGDAMSSATSPCSTWPMMSSSSSCGPRTSPSMSGPASWTSASPASTGVGLGAGVQELLALGFGASKFRYAGPAGRDWKIEDLQASAGHGLPALVVDD